MARLERTLLVICVLLSACCLLEGQKLSEEEPLETSQGSGFNPDDEDFEASGLPPENSVDDVHQIVKANPNVATTWSPSTSSSTTTHQTTVSTIRRPPDVTKSGGDASDKTDNKGFTFTSTYIIVGAVALLLVVLIVIIVIVRCCCCCRKSKNEEYTQGTTRSKNYV